MEKEYLIRQAPAKALLAFSTPMIIGNLFQQLYTMTDSVIVGQAVGESALAAVGASYALTNVFISIAIGGGVGASVLTSQAFGRRDYHRMKRFISTALFTFLAVSLLLGGFGLAFSGQIMAWLRTPASILDDAAVYLNIYFLGLPFLFMYNVLSAMFNALGRSKVPLYLLIFSSVLNVGLDLYLVLTLKMGVAGVAWATLIAQGVSAVAAFLLFARELRAYDAPSAVCFDVRELKNMARVALPSVFQQSTVSIGMMLVQSVVNSFGAETLAGLFRGHAYREHLHRAHGGGGQRDVLLHRAEHRGGGVQPCAQGIPGVLWHSGCVRAGDLRGASVLFAAAHCAVPQRGKLTPRAGDRNVLHSFPGVVLYPHRPENGHGRRAARRGRHGRVYRSKSCQPDAARGSGGSAGAPAGHPDGMVRGACGLGGQLPYLVFALPNGPLAGARRRAAGLTAAEKFA